MLTSLYQAFSAHLATLPGIANVDLWNQQLTDTEKPYAGAGSDWATPAVFVELVPSDFRSSGRHVQRATVTVRLRLITERYQETAVRAGTTPQADALASEGSLTNLLSAHATGWRHQEPGTGGRVLATSFGRIGLATDTDFSNVVETQLEFRTQVTDYAAVRPRLSIPRPPLTITPSE